MPLTLDQIFNADYYRTVNNLPGLTDAQALDHFNAIGAEQGLRFTPFVNVQYYKTVANPDLSSLSNTDALNHLLSQGVDQGRTFLPFIDLNYYQTQNSLSFATQSEALLNLQNSGLAGGLPFSPHVNLPEFQAANPTLAAGTLSQAFAELSTYGLPTDEGIVHIPVGNNAGPINIPDEYYVYGDVQNLSGEAIVSYSKANNSFQVDFNVTGLPYKLDATRPEDVSTSYNKQPVSVEDGAWQLWIIPRWFTVPTQYWYDGATNILIGNEHDQRFFTTPPVGTNVDVNGDGIPDIARTVNSVQMIESQVFEGLPDGTANITFSTQYNQMLDARGTGGTFVAALPYLLDDPNTVGVYYTEGGVDTGLAMNWDQALADIRDGGAPFNIALSLEPNPKPDYLLGRDNTMIAGGYFYPNVTPPGVVFDAGTGQYREAQPSDATNYAHVPWPGRLFEQARATTVPESSSTLGLGILALMMLGAALIRKWRAKDGDRLNAGSPTLGEESEPLSSPLSS